MSKQLWLGAALMVGGAIMVLAVINKPSTQTASQDSVLGVDADTAIAKPVVQPLTADVETEERILAQKQKEREARVRALEEQAKELLQAQALARTQALNKAQEEAQAYDAAAQPLVVQVRPESLALAEEQKQAEKRAEQQLIKKQEEQKEKQEAEHKAKADVKNHRHTVQSGDSLLKLSRQYGIPVSVIAAANDMQRSDTLQRGRTIKIPSQEEIDALKQKVRAQEQRELEQKAAAEKQKNANQRLADARREAKKQGVNGSYKVQVALAANQAKADALAKKLRSEGYKVTTEPDRRGVRVTVGPERSKEAAIALKDKINADPNVATHNAWVVQ